MGNINVKYIILEYLYSNSLITFKSVKIYFKVNSNDKVTIIGKFSRKLSFGYY